MDMVTSTLEPADVAAWNRCIRAPQALDAVTLVQLQPLITAQLRRAMLSMRADDPDRGAAAAVHMVFVRMFGAVHPFESRQLFFVFAAPIMRRLLLQLAQKSLDADANLVAADEAAALNRLMARLDVLAPHQTRAADLHYFCGLSVSETATTLGITVEAVNRDLRFTRAWLAYKQKANAQGNAMGLKKPSA